LGRVVAVGGGGLLLLLLLAWLVPCPLVRVSIRTRIDSQCRMLGLQR
jgi:hypothetical protein